MLSLLCYLPQRVGAALTALPREALSTATELRLRLDGPVSLTLGGKNMCFDRAGRFCTVEKGLRCTKEELADCVALLTKSSLYSYGDCIRQGYLPFGKGGRAGISGDAIVKNGTLVGFSTIHGINLRLRRFIKDYGYEAARRIREKGLRGALIYSPPNCGKTTLLTSIAALLAGDSLGRPLKVALADERWELFVPELKGSLVDAICGVEKAHAIELLCRTMSPQVLVCDELAAADGAPLRRVLGMGVALVATAHAENRQELTNRPFIKELLDTGAFPLLIRLGTDFRYSVEEYL